MIQVNNGTCGNMCHPFSLLFSLSSLWFWLANLKADQFYKCTQGNLYFFLLLCIFFYMHVQNLGQHVFHGLFQGYDVDCVLHKHLGPVNCIITSANCSTSGMQLNAVELAFWEHSSFVDRPHLLLSCLFDRHHLLLVLTVTISEPSPYTIGEKLHTHSSKNSKLLHQ